MGKSANMLNIFSVLLVISVLWKPAFTEDKCSLGCKGASAGATFLTGHKYTYGVEGTVAIYLTGADKQETSVKLLGQASVSALGNCAYVLKVQDLVISGPDGKKYQKPKGLEKPVRFTLQDGRLGSDICTEEGDTRRSLNIKRAIISLLQSEQKSSTEIDIFGVCPTEASSSQEGGAVLIHRSRDLSRCALREQGKNGLISAVYSPTAEIKGTHILQSILNVESKVNTGVPEKVSATEEYLYKPFSVGENGARAKVHTKLTLTGKSGGGDNGQFKEPRTIIFENPHGHKMEQSNAQAVIDIIKETSKTLGNEANSKSAGLFAQVVRIMRHASKDDLIKAYNQVKGTTLEKRVFLDGVLRAGTGDSTQAAVQLLNNKELSVLEQQLVFLSLGNARHTNDDALKAAASLLELPGVPKELYLGVGALAGSYCRDHYCHDGKSEGVTAISNKLAAKIHNCKPSNKLEEDYVVAALKGVRNIRHLDDSLVDKLVHCAVDHGVKSRVRVAALEGFHADPCAAKIKKTAIDLMKNVQLDSEIRIKAYLAVIDCPCSKTATEIKNLLDKEPVHQVGRFITTSLRHIRASANPDRQLARQHYSQITTPSRFNVDDRKYSFYREASYNVDALGLGGSIEETVIYSQDSFLPRSASLNLTAEVFGHSLNVFEVGGRQGNLDRVVEHFLGPKGLFRSKDPQAIYDAIVKQYQDAKKTVDQHVRHRRSVKNEIESFDKRVKDEGIAYDNELDLDIYVKLFGTDAIFLSLGDGKGFDFTQFLDKLLQFADKGINEAKHFQHEIRTHLLFLDAELAYPTSTGIPLKLDLTGAATGRFEVSSHVDLKQIMSSPGNAKLDIKLVPSTDVEVSGMFLIDADTVTTGLKVINNLHSSVGGHLTAKVLENGHGIDIQFALPIDKQEIVTATNDLVYVTYEKGQKEKHIPLKIDTERKEYKECFDQLSGMLGLTLCGEVSVPFSVSGPEAQASISKFLARYPLTGSSKVKLHLEKADLRGYHIKGVLRDNHSGHRGFELLFEAQGSKNRRTHLTGDLINTDLEKTMKLSLDSPLKVVSGQVSVFTKPSEYAMMMEAQWDAMKYYGRVGFNIEGGEARSVWKPIIEYQLPDQKKQELRVEGQVVKEKSGPSMKWSLEGVRVSVPNSNEVADISGHLHSQPGHTDLLLQARRGEHSVLLSGSLKGYDVKAELQNTLNPFINFKLNGHIENTNGLHHNDMDVYYGGDLTNAQNRVTFNQLYKRHYETPDAFAIISKNKLEIHAVPFNIKFDIEVEPKKLDMEVSGLYVDKKGELDLEARINTKKQGDYSVRLEAEVDKKKVEVLSKRDVVSDGKSNFENYVQISNIGKYELSGVVTHKWTEHDGNVGAVGHLRVTGGGKNDEIKFDLGAIKTKNLYSSHAKVSVKAGDYLDYLLKVTRGANPSGQLKLVLKDAVSANGQYQLTDADGKGNGMIIIHFPKIQRKIKGDIKFLAKEPTFNADIDLFLNFEKDNNDKIHFTTSSRSTDNNCDSKNKIEYAGKKFEVNLHREGSVWIESGKSNGLLEVVLPDERCLSVKYNRDVNIKDDVTNGNVEWHLSDAEKRGGAASTVTYKARAANTNLEKMAVDYEGELTLQLRSGKQLLNKFYVKHLPQGGDRFKFDFKSEVGGNLLPRPLSLSASGDYVNAEDLSPDGDAKYRMKGAYGDDVGFELMGNEDLRVMQGGDKKYLEEYTLSLRLPFEQAHDIKLVSNVMFLLPEKKDTFEYTVIESVQVNGELYKLDAGGKVGHKSGLGKVKVLAPQIDPLSLEVHYHIDLDEAGEKKTGHVEVKSHYGKGKSAVVAVDAASAPQDYTLNIRAQAPQAEKLKKLEFNWRHRRPTPDSHAANLIVDADGKVYKLDYQVVYSKANPLLDLKFSCPETASKPARIFLKGQALSSTQGKVDLKVENVREYNIDLTSEGTLQKDNVAFQLHANSEKLGWKNYKADITTKDAGAGKRLEFHVSNDNKNVLSGSTSFISKQEGQKTIIEGSGSVKVRDDQKSANFKYIRTVLTDGNEHGVETFLNLAIGERSYVAESRVTNLEYKSSLVYCEEKKQCANAELHSKVTVDKPGVLVHRVNVGVDLRKLGVTPEFGLQVLSEVSDKKLPQYNLHLHVNKDEKKYHLHVYSTPENGAFPSGITITLPSRVLAIESKVTYPAVVNGRATPGPIAGELVFHVDKNKPQLKTGARFHIDWSGNAKVADAKAEFAFFHPKLGREASLKINGKLNRPTDNNIKIETSASLSHPVLGADRESKLLLEINPENFKFFAQTPLVKVIDLESSTIMKDNLQQALLKFSLLEGKPVLIKAVVKDFTYYEFTTGYSDESERRLSIVGRIEPEKKLDVSADILLGGEKKNIAHGALFIQDNLVKSDYGVSKDNFNYFVNALKKDLDNLETRIEALGKKASDEFKATLKRVEPTFKQLNQWNVEELEKLYKELANDQVLKDISKALHDVVQYVAKLIDEVVTATAPFVDKFIKTVSETCNKVVELYEKKLEPQLKEVYKTVGAALKEYFDGLIDLVAHFAALVTDFFDKHKHELQELTNTVAEIFKDVTRLIVIQVKEIRQRAEASFHDLMQYIKDLPIVNMIQEKWNELAVPDQVTGVLNEIHNTIRNLLPTEECRRFADALNNYVQQKLKKLQIDDAAHLRVLYEKGAEALTSLVQFVRAQLNQLGVPGLLNFSALPVQWSPVSSWLPSWGGVVSFSPINQLMKGDLPDHLAILRAYRPRSLNPLDEVPNKLRAVVINGQHLFTFDGRHLTFPGNCRYVLAHDYVDQNFTLALQLSNGAPKALILQDKGGHTVEIRSDTKAALDGSVHPYPVIAQDSFAFREPNGRVGIGSLYGVMAFCTAKLEVCYIEVSGFYLGKLRGLLGDGNNEPFDDFRMPNGKISHSESEFGNAYKLTSSCPAIKTPEHSHHQMHGPMPPACEQVFGAASNLRYLSLFLDIAPFRQACVHAVGTDSANALQQACDLARGYTALAVTGLLPAVLPAVCVRCQEDGKPLNVGDNVHYTLPGRQADIVVVVETTRSNEKNYKDLVVQLVGHVVDGLKAKKVDDIKVYLIGVTAKYPYPIVYDTDLKLRNAKVSFDDEDRFLPTPRIETGYPTVDRWEATILDMYDKIRYSLGLHPIVGGYSHILELASRPAALKHIIVSQGSPCGVHNPIVDVLFANGLRLQSYTMSLVTVTPGLSVPDNNFKDVVAFDRRTIYNLGDKKAGDSARFSLQYYNNQCIDTMQLFGGLTLSASNFEALEASKRAQFLQTATSLIVDQMFSSATDRECTCVYTDPFRVQTICVPKLKQNNATRRK